MGGSSSSSSSQTQQTDERIAADSSVVADDHGTVNINVEDITPEVAASLQNFATDVLDFAETERKATRDLQEKVIQRSFDQADGGVPDIVRSIVKFGGVAGVAYLGLRYGPGLVRELK